MRTTGERGRVGVAGRERGASASVFLLVAMAALLVVCGLVVDGGAQVRAHRQAEVAAARAARAGVDATAAARLAGSQDEGAGFRAANASLAADGVAGEVTLADGRVQVATRTSIPTTFLQLFGIGSLRATGSATAELQQLPAR